jgi:hypothetical protein
MKSHLEPKNSANLIAAFGNVHLALRLVKGALKELHELVFTLEGDTIGQLLVIESKNRFSLESGAEVFIPAWLCECTCGTRLVVDHCKLMDESVKSCEKCKDQNT